MANSVLVEMIAMHNWEEMCKPIFQGWMRIRNGGELPNHVIYLRDGVSEGQYQHVLQQEVRDIQRVWAKIEPTTGASKKV